MSPHARAGLLCLTVALLSACASNGIDGEQVDLKEAAVANAQLGREYLDDGNVSLAIDKLERAVRQDSSLTIAHLYLAIARERAGNEAGAEQSFRKALAIEPRIPESWIYYGAFLCGHNRYDEAERSFARAAQIRPNPVLELAYTTAGVCFAQRNESKAEGYFRQALDVNPAYPDALAQMAKLSYRRGDFLSARAFIQRYEKVGKPLPETLLIAARAEAALGADEAAARYAARLKSEFPKSLEAIEIDQPSRP